MDAGPGRPADGLKERRGPRSQAPMTTRPGSSCQPTKRSNSSSGSGSGEAAGEASPLRFGQGRSVGRRAVAPEHTVQPTEHRFPPSQSFFVSSRFRASAASWRSNFKRSRTLTWGENTPFGD
jgi:hypothetical protein